MKTKSITDAEFEQEVLKAAGGREFDFVLLVGAVALFFFGAGQYSPDRLFFGI